MGRKKKLLDKGFPIVIAGVVGLLSVMGVAKLSDLEKIKDYGEWVAKLPLEVKVAGVVDGDTLSIDGDVGVRLLGINAPGRGEEGYEEAKKGLIDLVAKKKVWLEYDRYQDDKFGRLLAWVWVECKDKPKFLPYDYMRLSFNRSREGLMDNPVGCKTGRLVNEEMVRKKLVVVDFYKDRGEMKYQKRLVEAKRLLEK